MTQTMRPGQIYTYESPSGWCRDGQAVVEEQHDGSLVLRDTYWISSDGSDVLPKNTPVTLLVDLNEYTEVAYQSDGEMYADEDRFTLRYHAGCKMRHFVRTGAEPSVVAQINHAEARLLEAQEDLRSAQRHVARCEAEVRRLISGP